MKPWLVRLLATVLLATPFLSSSAAAEVVHFRNATWPPTPLQLLLQKSGQTVAEQARVTLSGELYRPAGRGPFPAVVLLHPCSGRLPRHVEDADAARYLALGYALLVVDSFGSRGITEGCSGHGLSVDVVMDAYGALLYLAGLSFIDADRIAIVGYSYGAAAALSAVAFDGVGRLFDQRFQAAVAYYPPCDGQAAAVAVPTLIVIGELDGWAPVKDCRAMMARRRGLGAPLRLVVYPDVHHAFNLDLQARRYYGHRLEFNESADRAAWAETVAILRQAFGR